MNSNTFTLYFSPLACSFATRAVLYDVEANATFVEVDKAHRTPDGGDYRVIHPLGLVPALVLEDGEVLTENAAVLQYLGDRFPERGLAPKDARERARLHSWLSFVGTELHKGVFNPLFDASAPAEMKRYVLTKADERLSWLASNLEGRTSLLESGVSVADAYLVAVLNWVVATPIDLKRWPALVAYHANLLKRPAFARAFAEERRLWADRNPERAKVIQQTP